MIISNILPYKLYVVSYDNLENVFYECTIYYFVGYDSLIIVRCIEQNKLATLRSINICSCNTAEIYNNK